MNMCHPPPPEAREARTEDLRLSSEKEDRLVSGWIKNHGRMLLAVAGRFADELVDAEDILQEVYMIALSQRHELRDADATGAWLAVITRNVGMQTARKHARRAELLKAYASEMPDTVGSRRTLEEDLRNARLQSAVHSLPEIQRTILLCRVVDEMSVKDTAATVGCAPGTVKSCLHRTLRALRSQLMVQPTTTGTPNGSVSMSGAS